MDGYGKDVARVKDAFVEVSSSGIVADQMFLTVLKKTIPRLAENFPQSMEGAVERQLLQESMQHALAQLVQQVGSEPVMEYGMNEFGFSVIERFLNMALDACDKQIIEPGFIATLVEDLVDCNTIMECEAVFAYLERQTATLLKPYINQRSKIIILRVCNQMLKRLSKSKDAQLCGRILSFLARFFPLSERSGVNVQGVYNDSHSVVIENVPEGAVDSNGEKIDAALYRQFWGLQSVFQNPTQVLQSQNTWTQTSASINRILQEFQRRPPVGAQSDNNRSNGDINFPSRSVVAGAGQYLSSSQLFHLQLRDATFRKHFLIQCLILCQYCRMPGKSDKEPMKGKQLEELCILESTLLEALRKLPPDGQQFAQVVGRILQREAHWVDWKKAGCYEFDKPRDSEALKRDRPAEDYQPKKLIKVNSEGLAESTGCKELDRLWSQPSHLKVSERGRLCSLEEFLEPVIQEMDPEQGIEEQYKTRNDKLYKWRAMRLLSKYSLQTLAKIHMSLPQITKLMGQDCGYDGHLKFPSVNVNHLANQEKLYGNLELIIADLFPEKLPKGWVNPFSKLEKTESAEDKEKDKGKEKDKVEQQDRRGGFGGSQSTAHTSPKTPTPPPTGSSKGKSEGQVA
eukprot:TRINITY_DN4894_c0_g1_i2.p1 TRINITY_DN4894_c0_g1~~TRINITY_DN4894_c0_g1_i2.p1  ORF type:complete len:627 (-),score=82.35 TRINITY_DN4894_c0_g1_i2:206-2086(-)